MVISHATSVVQQRAIAQESADSIAIACVIGGVPAARQLEELLHVTITQLRVEPNHVMVEVSTGEYVATSEATSGR